jgi:RNA polymerase sigma-70 factor (ECF subfamily)
MSESSALMRLQVVTTEIAAISQQAPTDQADAVGRIDVLYREHRDVVVRFLRTICSNDELALDLAAATFERAFRELRAGRDPGLGWLLRVARNAAIDSRRRARVAALFLQHPTRLETPEDSAEEHVVGRDTARLIRAAVSRLPLAQREAIGLRFTTDLAVREIAVVVGRSPDATEKLISRGLQRLREDLDDLV